jgi:DNA-directed RNA polymerase specialized sigma24 family protein
VDDVIAVPIRFAAVTPGVEREALRLRVVDELPGAAIAQRLGITDATARARVSLGLRGLARVLDPMAKAEGRAG